MAFHEWAVSVAADTAGGSDLIRGQWGQQDRESSSVGGVRILILSTGTVPFEVAQRHYYASDQSPYLLTQPQNWSEMDDKPLFWGELGNNLNGQPTRWYYADDQIRSSGGQAICSMTLIGTPGYPNENDALLKIWPSIVIPVDYEIVPALLPLVHFMSATSSLMGGIWIYFILMLGMMAIVALSERYGLPFHMAGILVFLLSTTMMFLVIAQL